MQADPIPILYPPGLFRIGTEYQAKGRWYEGDLVRWFNGLVRPVGGWTSLATGLTGQASGVFTWVDNSANGICAIGTEQELVTMTPAGTVTDRTPSAFSTQATTSTWTMDAAGQLLFAVNDADGVIYKYLPGTDTLATKLSDEAGASGVPTAEAILVTNEGIPMALGADGNPRAIAWSDRDDLTDWSAGLTDLAGDLNVQASAGLKNGKNVRAGTLLWTGEDLHLARYIGLPDVYGVKLVASDCGAVSRHAMAVVHDTAYWMSHGKFMMCQGGGLVSEIPCDVYDDVFGDLDLDRIHLVQALVNSQYNEIWWLYRNASDSGTANMRAVVYNYAEKHWSLHVLARHAGISRGKGFSNPLMIGGTTVWKHESGSTKSGAGTPYVQGGPIEIGMGERLLHAREVVTDDSELGDVDLYFSVRLHPNDAATEYGPYSAAAKTPVRFCGRQVALKLVEAEATDWRIGTYRLVGKPGSRR